MVVIGAGGVGGAENINNWLIIVKQFSLFEFREKIMIAFNSKKHFPRNAMIYFFFFKFDANIVYCVQNVIVSFILF